MKENTEKVKAQICVVEAVQTVFEYQEFFRALASCS